MPNVSQINSGKGLVTFTQDDLIDLDLTKWIRADSKGITKRDFISVQPIEKQAAKVYKEKFPSTQVKLAEKCFLRDDGSVDVVLRVARDVSDGNYKKHPTKLTFLGEARAKEQSVDTTVNKEVVTFDDAEQEKTGSTKSKLSMPIDFLEENIDKLSEEEVRQIYAELGTEHVDAFLEDIRLALAGSDENIDRMMARAGCASVDSEETTDDE